MSKGLAIVVRPVDSGAEIDQVLGLYRLHKRTLGFLPNGAFREHAAQGRLLIALVDNDLVGYLVYGVSRGSARIIHLCVDEQFRRKGVSTALMNELVRAAQSLTSILLSCRIDYAANELWPRLGFVNSREKPGRGADSAQLLIWERQLKGSATPLLDLIHVEKLSSEKLRVAVDANVFFDWYSEEERAEESKGLLSDWLEGELNLCVTAELGAEIRRNPDVVQQREMMKRFNAWTPQLKAHPDACQRMVAELNEILPPLKKPSDESDRRQIAHAICEQAEYFITRDVGLLAMGALFAEKFGIKLKRPGDLLLELSCRLDESYAPARLVGTSIVTRPPLALHELDRFQRFSSGESKAEWLGVTHSLLGDGKLSEVRLLQCQDADPCILVGFNRSEHGVLKVQTLRSLRHPLSATLVRRALAELLLTAHQQNLNGVRVLDVSDPLVGQALQDLRFIKAESGYFKPTSRAVVARIDLLGHLQAVGLGAGEAEELLSRPATEIEMSVWPTKIAGEGIRSFVVPIKPWAAAALFDERLASQEIFGVDSGAALSLENVYYSGKQRFTLPEGARILWYVSTEPRRVARSIRACSISLGDSSGTAKQLHGQFRRLGVYRWEHVFKLAKQDLSRTLTAFRFAFTERLANPVPFAQIQAILQKHGQARNTFTGPVEISEKVFEEVYLQGMSVNV